MMKQEFDNLVGITTAQECYERIEYVYMKSEQFRSKQEIAEFYKKYDMNGIEKVYKEIREKEVEKWGKEEKTVTLTNSEWSDLTTYILMTTNHRNGEFEAWKKLEEEEGINGNKVFENAASNAQFWQGMISSLNEIKNKIENY